MGARFSQEELVALVEREQPVAMLSRNGQINYEVQSASKKLKAIGRQGVGMMPLTKPQPGAWV